MISLARSEVDAFLPAPVVPDAATTTRSSDPMRFAARAGAAATVIAVA